MKLFCLSIACLIFLFASSSAQTKYFIYLIDKGEGQTQSFNKSAIERDLLNSYSIKSIERRKKNSTDHIFTYSDYPIYQTYKNSLESIGIKIINELPWFNAVSVYLDDHLLDRIHQLQFVAKVEKVKSLIFRNEFTLKNSDNHFYFEEKFSKGVLLDYGNSFTQLNLSKIPALHEKGITGQGVLIGLLDTGFRWRQHESLQNVNVIAERDFVFGDDTTANQPGD
ncbi:MAG: hypothetical protein KJ666_13135, partial [Bacteroidetes bacterium]|nr:hypothetical protein [Bacteroidota bacterium]